MEYREPHDFLDYGNVATWDVSAGTINGRTIYGGSLNWSIDNIWDRVTGGSQYTTRTFSVSKFNQGQFVSASMGKRQQVGKLQSALLDVYFAHVNMLNSVSTFTGYKRQFQRDYQLYKEVTGELSAANLNSLRDLEKASEKAELYVGLEVGASFLDAVGEFAYDTLAAASEAPPEVNGTANSLFSALKSAVKVNAAKAKFGFSAFALSLKTQALYAREAAGFLRDDAASGVQSAETSTRNKIYGAEFGHLYDTLASSVFDMALRISELQKAREKVTQVYAEASRVIAERTDFRTRAAAVIQGYRTKDVVFRDLHNEELVQYGELFNLAQIYTYCAAKAYDYETGLINSSAGKSFTQSIITNWSLGAFSGSDPVSTSIGDSGLGGILAALRDDWEVVKGRTGLNNPDRNGTLFSLRQELFRIRTDQATDDDNTRWKEVLQQRIMSNVLNDADVVAYCANIGKASGGVVPGIVIPFGTTIEQGQNFFGWPYAAGDHNFSQSTFATKILSAGVVFKGYTGMDGFDRDRKSVV
jgi:hypothetical protein